MPFTRTNQVFVGLLVLLTSCYNSHKTGDSIDSDADVHLEERGGQSAEVGGFLDTSDFVDTGDSFDTSDSGDAGASLDAGVDGSTLVGNWEGELRFYDADGTLASVLQTTVEFTDIGIEVTVEGVLIEFRYSVDTDQSLPYLNIELFDPTQALPPYIIPAYYNIENDILTFGVSFYSEQPKTIDPDEMFFPMVFEVVRVL